MTQNSGTDFFSLPLYEDLDEEINLTIDLESVQRFATAVVTRRPPGVLNQDTIIFNTDFNGIVGTYEVYLTLAAKNLNSNTFTLYVEVVSD